MRRTFWTIPTRPLARHSRDSGRPPNRHLPLIGLLAALAFLPRSAAAATFTVNSTVDDVDAVPGDGVCSTASSLCTLRAAVQEANVLPGAHTIVLSAATYPITIAASYAEEDQADYGDLDISGTVAIIGILGATVITVPISSSGRIFDVQPAGSVSVSGVTFTHGTGHYGGAIRNQGTLNLDHCSVSRSDSWQGGALYNAGAATITDSAIQDSDAGSGVPAGGGIYNSGTLVIARSRISGNTVAALSPGSSAIATGGGIFSYGDLTLTNVVIESNCSMGDAGGLWTSGVAHLNNVTIRWNRANCQYWARYASVGGGVVSKGTTRISNSAITNNSTYGGDVQGVPNPIHGSNCAGTLTSEGYNLLGDLDSCIVSGDQSGNLTGSASPLDAGNPAPPGSGGNACEAVDQRGVARPVGSRCDIGALEAGGADILTLRVRPDTSVATDNGYVKVKVQFNTSPPADTLATSSGVSVQLTDGFSNPIASCSWTAAECAALPRGRIKCRTAGRKFQITFKPSPSTANAYVATASCKGFGITGQFQPPFGVILSQGVDVAREGAIGSCVASPLGTITCSP